MDRLSVDQLSEHVTTSHTLHAHQNETGYIQLRHPRTRLLFCNLKLQYLTIDTDVSDSAISHIWFNISYKISMNMSSLSSDTQTQYTVKSWQWLFTRHHIYLVYCIRWEWLPHSWCIVDAYNFKWRSQIWWSPIQHFSNTGTYTHIQQTTKNWRIESLFLKNKQNA